MEVVPDWARVYAAYDGLHIEGDALHHPAFYGWDAESTAWFNTKHLAEHELVGLPSEPEEPEENPRRGRKRQANGKLTRQERRKLFRRLMRS